MRIVFVCMVVIICLLFLTLKEIPRFKNMESLYDSAVKVSPQNPRTRYNYGLTLISRSEYDKAIEEFKMVRDLNPLYNVIYVWKNIANCYNEIGHIGEAKKYYIKTLFLVDDKESLMKLATIYWYEGEVEKARLLLERSVDIEPDAVSYNNLGLCYWKKKEYDKSIESFNHAVKLEPGYTDAWLNLINLYDLMGNKSMVVAETDRMAEIYAKNGWRIK